MTGSRRETLREPWTLHQALAAYAPPLGINRNVAALAMTPILRSQNRFDRWTVPLRVSFRTPLYTKSRGLHSPRHEDSGVISHARQTEIVGLSSASAPLLCRPDVTGLCQSGDALSFGSGSSGSHRHHHSRPTQSPWMLRSRSVSPALRGLLIAVVASRISPIDPCIPSPRTPPVVPNPTSQGSIVRPEPCLVVLRVRPTPCPGQPAPADPCPVSRGCHACLALPWELWTAHPTLRTERWNPPMGCWTRRN